MSAKKLLPGAAQPADSKPDGNALPCKSQLLAELLSEPSNLQRIGSALDLYMRLVLVDGGSFVGTYKELGRRLGRSDSAVKRSAKHLEKNEVATIENKGNRVKITLMDEHMEIAQAPEVTVQYENGEPEISLDALKNLCMELGRQGTKVDFHVTLDQKEPKAK